MITPKDIAVRFSADGSQIEIGFRTEAAVEAVSLTPEQASRLVALLINRASEVSERVAVPPLLKGGELEAPILSSSVGFARGRDDDEAVVAFQVGTLSLAFAVPTPMLIELCRRLLATAIPGEAPKPH